MIVVVITGPSVREARRQIRSARRHAAMFELRLDMIRNAAAAGLVRYARKPCIVTCRPVREGGAYRGSEAKRLEALRNAARSGAAYIDIELDAFARFRDVCAKAGIAPRTIVSHHQFSAGRIAPRAVYRALHRTGADVVKFAYAAADAWQISHAREFLALARRDNRKAIAIAMGEAGEASRILYRVFGGWASYGAPDGGEGSAPGQIPARVLASVFKAHRLSPATRVFGLVGNPVRQSKGIYIHNPVYRAAGLDAVYVRFPVEDLSRFMRRMGDMLSGCSVTLPHKEQMVRHCVRLAPAAAVIGAVNTVVRGRGGWFGANTDAGAALDAIEERRAVRGRTVAVLGAGGAAKAIAAEAKRRGAHVIVTNRTAARARFLARRLGVEWVPAGNIQECSPDILVNATSVGMWPDQGKSPVARIPASVALAFDAVYNPPVTVFLTLARRQGAVTVSGAEMYERQAVEQIRLLTGHTPSVRTIRRLFHAAVRR